MNNSIETEAEIKPRVIRRYTLQGESLSQDTTGFIRFCVGLALGVLIATAVAIWANSISQQVARDALSADAIREAARLGASEAIEFEATRVAQLNELKPLAQPTTAPQVLLGPAKPPEDNVITIREANVRGKSDAPVTMVEFGDFGCYFCTKFHSETLSKLIDQYVEGGQMRIVYKHMPIISLHPGADAAAIASECAADQGKFWEYHDVLFARNADGFDQALLNQYAKDLKLDMTKFAACLGSTDASARLQTDLDQAANLGFRGTPSFLINGKQVIGAQPYAVFVQTIEEALGKK
jgi:protein-disulfide isomerase